LGIHLLRFDLGLVSIYFDFGFSIFIFSFTNGLISSDNLEILTFRINLSSFTNNKSYSKYILLFDNKYFGYDNPFLLSIICFILNIFLLYVSFGLLNAFHLYLSVLQIVIRTESFFLNFVVYDSINFEQLW
jgi:hypothetical protein